MSIRFSAGKNCTRGNLLHLMIATNVVKVGVGVQYPGETRRVSIQLAHLRHDEAGRIVSTTSVHEETGKIPTQIDELERAATDLTFQQEDAVKQLLHDAVHLRQEAARN